MTFATQAKIAKRKGEQLVLHDYQLDCVKWIIKHPSCAQFLPPGLGKTATTLKAFSLMKAAGIVDTLFVIAPIRVMQAVWPAEIKKWAEFNDLKIVTLHGGEKDANLAKQADIYVVNPDGLKWFSKKSVAFFGKTGKTMLVVDESSNFRNGSSLRFKLLKAMLPNFTRKVILTGTPATNGLGNLWAQIYILDGGKRLGKFASHFMSKYYYPSGYKGYNWSIRDGAEADIYKCIGDIAIHKGRNELNMPDLIEVDLPVVLPNLAKRAYDDMRNQMLTELESGDVIIAKVAAAMVGKLKQISSGAVYNGNEAGGWTHIHDAKLEALEELHDELQGRPLMVFYEYRHELERLTKRFTFAKRLGGGMSSDETNAVIKSWNAGEITMLLLHPQSAGHGLNLQGSGCEDLAWLSITYDLELREQAISRVWRQGVTNAVTVHDLIAAPIDSHILDVLRGKATVQNALLEALRA